jgi:ataxin-3
LSSQNQNKKSYNYDDTGYFSISVLERALEVWDLTLVRWRGEAMKPYQEHPECVKYLDGRTGERKLIEPRDQAAFILNLASHWIPLRRFSPHPPTSGSTKRWYNLNSFLPNGPEWISPTYLRLVLAQAEEEGYSVFCVRKATPGGAEGQDIGEGTGWGDGGVGVLPESEADRMAVVLGEPVSRTGNVGSPPASRSSGRKPPFLVPTMHYD